jgi:hypothetical protein
MNAYDDVLESRDSIYTTAAYAYTSFEGAQITFTGSYSDTPQDTNSDGVYETLTVNVGVTASLAGDYEISGFLYDSTSKAIVSASATVNLAAGAATVPLVFDGLPIGINGKNGPYTLSGLAIHDAAGKLLTQISNACATSAYAFTSFKSVSAEFNNSFSDMGVDTDNISDGLFDILRIAVGIHVDTAGSYTLSGTLYGSDNSVIETTSANAALTAGDNMTMYLEFDGREINKKRVDGPYKLKILTLYKDGLLIDLLENAYTANMYLYTAFDAQPIALTGNYTDNGTDTNGDGTYDYLDITVEVVAQSAITVGLSARIMDTLGHEIAWAAATQSLAANTPTQLLLRYDAQDIYANNVDGPYYFRDVYAYNIYDTSQEDHVIDGYTTQSIWQFAGSTTTTTSVEPTTTTTLPPTTTVAPTTTTTAVTSTTTMPSTTTLPSTTSSVASSTTTSSIAVTSSTTTSAEPSSTTTTIGAATTTALVTTTAPAVTTTIGGTTTTTTLDNTTSTTTTTAVPGTTTTTISDNTTSTTTTPAGCIDKDGDGYGDNCTAGPDCDDNDAFYTDVCPDCTVKVIPKSLGWFLGEKENTRSLLIIGTRGTVFDQSTPVRWETGKIAVVSKRVFFKRFMFMKVSIDGAALGKGDYRVLIGNCSGKLTMVK